MKFGVLILAAGASRRMGQPKLLLPWSGKTVIQHLVDQWTCLGAAEVKVVLSDHGTELEHELDRLKFSIADRIVNPQPNDGMFSSIRCASHNKLWADDLTHFVITLGDQPHLKHSTLQQLLQFVSQNEDRICQPSLNGGAKHPVVLPRLQFEELASTNAQTLKAYLSSQQEPVALIELGDEGLGFDLDTPEDYEEALKRFGG